MNWESKVIVIFNGKFYELSLKINVLTIASKIDSIDEENYKNILNDIKMLNIQGILDEFNNKQESLNVIQYQVSSMLYIFFTEFQRYWDGIKPYIEEANKDQKKLDALILHNAKERINVALSARTLCWSIAYVNHSEDI